MERKTALVSGATAGIGEAVAKGFAANNFNLVITGRRNERLQEIADECRNVFGVAVYTLCFDVRDRAATEAAVQSLPPEWKQIDVLVNNAGLAAGLDAVQNGLVDDWDLMIDTNVKGLLYLTRQIAPGMVERNRGHIINMGSLAGKFVYEKGGVYCATKFAVDALSQAMRIDMVKHRIKVTAVHPGAVETEFSLVRFNGDEQKAANVYKGYEPLTANDVADVVLYCATLPEHVCIDEVIVTPIAQANPFYLNRR